MKTTVIGAIAVIALLLGGYAALHASNGTVGPQGPQGIAGPQGPVGPAGVNGNDGKNGSNGSTGASGQVFGAASGPDLFYPTMSFNGVKHWYFTPKFFGATTTPITFKGPSATSTLALGSGCYFSVSSTTAKTLVLAKALFPNATTTLLVQATSNASAVARLVATSSADTFTVGPNQYLSLSMIGGTGVDSPAGDCEFEFTQL